MHFKEIFFKYSAVGILKYISILWILRLARKVCKKLKDSRIRLQYIIKISIVSKRWTIDTNNHPFVRASSIPPAIVQHSLLVFPLGFFSQRFPFPMNPNRLQSVALLLPLPQSADQMQFELLLLLLPIGSLRAECRQHICHSCGRLVASSMQQAASCATLATLATSLPHFLWLLRLP